MIVVVAAAWLVTGFAFVVYRLATSPTMRRQHWDAALMLGGMVVACIAGPISPVVYILDGLRIDRRRRKRAP